MSLRPVYILGTGLSHDGSACILKDGHVAVAIEKERLSRRKHDGGNDALAVGYCLDALALHFSDLSLVVQAANFEKDIRSDRYQGPRLHHPDVPVLTLSHHLAHAYSAVGNSPYTESNVLVVDGAGSPAAHCDDWPDDDARSYWLSQPGLWCEKDSFYRYDRSGLTCLRKDFSEMRQYEAPSGAIRMPTIHHSIGGLYAAVSHYCFGNLDDAGKLMGLAPYGTERYREMPLFVLEDGTVRVVHESLKVLQQPAADHVAFKAGFKHYADVARWVQAETERAVSYLVRSRAEQFPNAVLCYAGGVALNAVANAALLREGLARELYIQPAAGDNGLAIGCAYYGWHAVQGREIPHGQQTPSPFFGKSHDCKPALALVEQTDAGDAVTVSAPGDPLAETVSALIAGKVIGWYQGGAEFGPRALGHRSILADPRQPGIRDRINRDVKLREDFRPFAPAILREEVHRYFQHGWDSPHMILVDAIRDEWRALLDGVIHVDGTCRVQTVDRNWNPLFYNLIQAFGAATGTGVLLNTSLNRKGMPIVETPQEAVTFFLESALDVLVLGPYFISKNSVA